MFALPQCFINRWWTQTLASCIDHLYTEIMGRSDAYASDPPWQIKACPHPAELLDFGAFVTFSPSENGSLVSLVIYVSFKMMILIIRQNLQLPLATVLETRPRGDLREWDFAGEGNLLCLHLRTTPPQPRARALVEDQNASGFSFFMHPEPHMGNKNPNKQKEEKGMLLELIWCPQIT